MLEKYKKIIAVIASMLLIVGVFKFSTSGGPEVAVEVSLDESAIAPTQIIVHVDGAVVAPGIYELAQGERVGTAIEKAGGLLENANTDLINYASVLEDGQKITVLKKESLVVKDSDVGFDEDEGVPRSIGKVENKGEDALPIYKRTDYTMLEKINYMTAEDFQAVPGIGEKISQDIIAYRNQVGQFNDMTDLINVSGIGEGKMEKIIAFMNQF